ncbi:hypothetical protein PAMP_004242 [Pampus punctatissimus]
MITPSTRRQLHVGVVCPSNVPVSSAACLCKRNTKRCEIAADNAGERVFTLGHTRVLVLSQEADARPGSHEYTCNSPLVSMLPQSSFQSSSESSFSYAAHNAKLNRKDGTGGWSPMVTDREPWLQVDLRDLMEVTAVATQGHYNSRYLLLYSDTGQAWKQYRQEDGVGWTGYSHVSARHDGAYLIRFAGNMNLEAIVQIKLSHSVRTRFLRFVPLDLNSSSWLSLRVEVYGCSHKSDVADFDGRSSLLYRFNQKSMSTAKDVISLRFKSQQAEGVLLHGEGQRGDYITLELHRGKLAFYLNLGHIVNDGLWHSVSLDTRGLQVSLTLDNEPASTIEQWEQLEQLEPRGSFYFGGCPLAGCQNLTLSFQGCMRLISINSQPINLSHIQQGLLGNYNQLQFDTCSIRDRLTTSVSADKPDQCVYLDSQTELFSRRSTSTFGKHLVIVYLPGFGAVGDIYPLKPHVMKFNYNASSQQLRAMVTASEQCQQEVVYTCRKSRLFNTKDGHPLSWWVDQGGQRWSYWGGFLSGVQQCSCSLEENCIDMNYFCNCDADTDSWVNDTGVLSNKDHLPLSHIVIGDTNRTDSEAVYRVGPLRCYGDKSIWNAASFYQESSYLHFPTLHAELASDISFYFKTDAPSGVFLENQGHKNFIRVELSSPSVVTFSFDVGNGPAVLAVKSHLPLNDQQWHYVRAERNVKEASLHVDQLPVRFLEAPPDGHHHLRLNSQLFVGGTASQLRGFLGCIRALTINGITFDLGERAKMVPGVSSSCPGYCGSATSLCHNRGRCIEKRNGYACDCSQSAYGGPTCKDEVSVSFDRESSVTFMFQEPFSVIRNRSSHMSSISRESSSSSRAREDVAFSFVTSQSPAMLLTVSTFNQQYIAVILAHNGSLQIWYRLQRDRSPEVYSPALSCMADGLLHRIRIHREGKHLYVQFRFLVTIFFFDYFPLDQIDQDVDRKYTLSSDAELILIRSLTLGKVTSGNFAEEVVGAGSKGFIGCLSSVQFNHVAPLKAALLNRGSSLVMVRGPLVQSNCGVLADSITSQDLQDQFATTHKDNEQHDGDTQNDVAVIAGAVTAVAFITLCIIAVVTRFLYQWRSQSSNSSVTEKEHQHSVETRYRTELHLHNTVRDNMKEYYI